LLVGQVSSSHAGSISRDPPTFETHPSRAGVSDFYRGQCVIYEG
jgi:hypothetical protein